ncbi:MAG: redoxin domain-containing protein, partial [Aureliella sp.]
MIRQKDIPKLTVAAFVWLVAMSASNCQAKNLAFSLPAVSGESIEVHASEDSAGTAATVVCFLGTECPMARGYAAQLNALQSEFSARGVRIIGVMSNRQD